MPDTAAIFDAFFQKKVVSLENVNTPFQPSGVLLDPYNKSLPNLYSHMGSLQKSLHNITNDSWQQRACCLLQLVVYIFSSFVTYPGLKILLF